MEGNYGVIAEGWFNGVFVSSLGKAGVAKDGKLKTNACYTLKSALYRALKRCANQYRFSKDGVDGWIEFPSLPATTQDTMIEEISNVVELEMIEPTLFRTTFTEATFENAMRKVWG